MVRAVHSRHLIVWMGCSTRILPAPLANHLNNWRCTDAKQRTSFFFEQINLKKKKKKTEMWHDETKYENKKLKFGRAFYLYIRIACQSISTSYFSRFFCVCVRDRSPSYLICFSLLTVEEQTDFFLTNFLASFLVSCGRPPPCYKISLTPGHSLILFLFLFFYIRVRCWVKTTATKRTPS